MSYQNKCIMRDCSVRICDGETLEDKPKVNVEKAIQQQKQSAEVVESIGMEVYHVPTSDEHPDCVFIEDPVFFLDGRAFYPRMGADSRRGERGIVKDYVEKHFPDFKSITMEGSDSFMDGGDILYFGGPKKEIMVGVSTRTNLNGIAQLQAAFPDYVVTPIEIPPPSRGGQLHLISMTSLCEPGVLAIGTSPAAKEVEKTIKEKAVSDVEFFHLPNDWAANAIRINGYTIHCTKDEFPDSYALFQDRYGDKGLGMENQEFEKVDGSLTCRVRQIQYGY